MHLVNQPYVVKLQLNDESNNPIINASPVCLISNVTKTLYWNGIAFSSISCNLSMTHLGDGLYGYTFIPFNTGTYVITCQNLSYEKEIILDVIADDSVIRDWPVNKTISLNIVITNDDGTAQPTALISRAIDNKYYDGITWQTEKSNIALNRSSINLFTLDFMPMQEDTYTIEIREDQFGYSKTYTLTSKIQEGGMIKISSSTFKAPDGSDSRIVDDFGKPLKDATITAYSKGVEVAKAKTDNDGNWNMFLLPDKYIFLVECARYNTLSFEREVL